MRWEAAPLPCSVCRRATNRWRRQRLAPLLAYSWTLALASRKAIMFWTSLSRSESTGGRRRLALVQGSGRRRPSMTLRGALAPARGHVLSTARRRYSCAWAPARAHTLVHAQAHALAGARVPARACTPVHALAGARAHESQRGPHGTPWHQSATMCSSQPINATGMGAGAVGAMGAGTGAGTGATSSHKASSSLSQSALCS